jgi:hypothetical protein
VLDAYINYLEKCPIRLHCLLIKLDMFAIQENYGKENNIGMVINEGDEFLVWHSHLASTF